MSFKVTESLMIEIKDSLQLLLPEAEIHKGENIVTVTIGDTTRTIAVVGELFKGVYKTENVIDYGSQSVTFNDSITLPVVECFPFK